MFIRHENSSIINLDNVSNIFIDRKESKVIFNMNYGVKLNNTKMESVIRADFEKWSFDDLQEMLDSIDPILKEAGFIAPNSIYNRYVNPKCVSSIKIDEEKFKVIFNLNTTVTHPFDVKTINGDRYNKGKDIPFQDQQLSSDFVFIKFNNADDFYDYVEKIDEIYTVI